MMWRIAWYGDKDAKNNADGGVLTSGVDPTLFTMADGFWKRIFAIEKGKEVPVKEADHCMDAIRYVVMGAWSKIKHWLPLDIVEDDVNIGDISSREVREEDEYL